MRCHRTLTFLLSVGVDSGTRASIEDDTSGIACLAPRLPTVSASLRLLGTLPTHTWPDVLSSMEV